MILVSDKDNSQEVKFKLNFSYSLTEYKFGLLSNSQYVFKLINPLIYHEYWYRPLECRGDYLTQNYNAQHKYKVNIENYYTTYLPDATLNPEID